MELNLKLAQKRSWGGRWSWAAIVGLLSLRVVPQQQCNGHCLCDSAQTRQLKQQLSSALVAGQWREDTAVTLPLFWRRSTVSPVFFGPYPRSSLHSFVPPLPPPHPVPVSNKPPRFYGRKVKWSTTRMIYALRWTVKRAILRVCDRETQSHQTVHKPQLLRRFYFPICIHNFSFIWSYSCLMYDYLQLLLYKVRCKVKTPCP